MGEIVLRAKNVFKSYSNGEDSLHVLKDLSIEVRKGKLSRLQENQVLGNQLYLIFLDQ